jgi:DNA-binding IclR family transcriptional regulator
MSINYKRVPAIDKCFSILEFMTQAKRPLAFTEIVKELNLNKSTVFNILHTLNDIDVIEKGPDGLFRLGTKLFTLGTAAASDSELIQAIHPILETINNKFKLSSFLGILSEHEVIIIDKADHAQKIKISSEIGMRIPIFAGVAGKALISQLPDPSIDDILRNNSFERYTSKTITDKTEYKKEILKVKKTGIAYDMEEYIEGLIAAAIPVRTFRDDLQAAIWAVGLKQEFRGNAMKDITKFLFDSVEKINCRFSIMTGAHKQ